MTTDEINKYIHVEIMGKCGHPKPLHKRESGYVECVDCGSKNSPGATWKFPNYCSDSSPRSLLLEVIEKLDGKARREFIDEIDALKVGPGYGRMILRTTLLTAEQIARAAVEAHRTSGNPTHAKDSTETAKG